jgi:hypothetical protein
MGMDQRVSFAGAAVPSWQAARDLLASLGYPVQMRMIGGQLAFPDEQPPESWQELRVSTPGGMVTLRREADTLVFVTWGNADAGLRQAWNALVWACAKAGDGRVLTAQGELDAGEFRRFADLPEALRG